MDIWIFGVEMYLNADLRQLTYVYIIDGIYHYLNFFQAVMGGFITHQIKTMTRGITMLKIGLTEKCGH